MRSKKTKYVDLDCKMIERKEQVENNSGHIDGNCKGLRELIDVKAKINQDTEERVQICEDLKEQNKGIMNTNDRKGEYRNFQESWKGFIKNYWERKSNQSDKWYEFLNQYKQEMDEVKKFVEYFVEGNLEDEVLKKNVVIEMNIIDVNVGKDDENDSV
ncbi:hypothetical protein FQA39_LY16350 [Lamprigera yunnana]|nr:hypothetical protein FQA39_LY16350 [Lamprigera yunnana]